MDPRWRHWWPAPAKLNLFLHVTGRRADGYHELQTLFQFVELGDRLRFHPRADQEIRRIRDLPGVGRQDDLCLRAARRLRADAGIRTGVDVELEKTLPMGGGLGGGSSNAATVLLALNRLWGLGYSVERLAELGLGLGADVPVFVRGRAAWAEGVGEQLRPVDIAEPWYLILLPPVHLSTAEVFGDPELTRNCAPIKIRDFLRGGADNVCTPVVRKRQPVVGQYLDWLNQFAPARMTGTGACVFAGFESRERAREAYAQVPEDWQAWVARGANRSPLHAMLDRLDDTDER